MRGSLSELLSTAPIDALRTALHGFTSAPSLIHVRAGSPFAAALAKVGSGQALSDDDVRAAFAASSDSATRRSGPQIIASGPGKAVALVSMRGVALYDLEYQPWCFSTKHLKQTIDRLAADKDIGTIVIVTDSPGGSVTGVKEAGDSVYAARKKKPVIAIVDPMCASAAYWIASQATEISAVPSADVGSVGVFVLHIDYSEMMKQVGIKPTFVYAGEHKVEGNPYQPLAPGARAHLQGEVNKTYADFVSMVARGRGVEAATVKANFGGGRLLDAKDARRVGMIDRVVSSSSEAVRFVSSPAAARAARLADLKITPATAALPLDDALARRARLATLRQEI